MRIELDFRAGGSMLSGMGGRGMPLGGSFGAEEWCSEERDCGSGTDMGGGGKEVEGSFDELDLATLSQPSVSKCKRKVE